MQPASGLPGPARIDEHTYCREKLCTMHVLQADVQSECKGARGLEPGRENQRASKCKEASVRRSKAVKAVKAADQSISKVVRVAEQGVAWQTCSGMTHT